MSGVLSLCFFIPFSIAITSLREERSGLSALCAFVWFAPVGLCLFPFPLGVRDRLRFVVVKLPAPWTFLFSFMLIFDVEHVLSPTFDAFLLCISVIATMML